MNMKLIDADELLECLWREDVSSREKIADKLHISVSTLDKRIKHLKDVYDEVQRQHPELELPTRTSD